MHAVGAEDALGDVGEVVGGQRPRRGVLRAHDLGEHRLEGGQQTLDVLVGHHAHDADQRRERERLLQGVRGRLGAVRVVRAVEHDGRAAPRDLEPAGRVHRREGLAYDLGVELVAAQERLHRGDRTGGVVRLVRTVQRQEDLVVLARQPAHRDDLAADAGQPAADAELEPLTGDGGPHLGGVQHQHLGHLERLLGEYGHRARLDDPGLLGRDRGRVVTEVCRVVDRDRRHDGDLPVGHVRGVPRAAHPHLHHGRVDGCVGEGCVRHAGDDLEERHRVRAPSGRPPRRTAARRRTPTRTAPASWSRRRGRSARSSAAGAGWCSGRCAARWRAAARRPCGWSTSCRWCRSGARRRSRAAGRRAGRTAPGCGRATGRAGSPASGPAVPARPRRTTGQRARSHYPRLRLLSWTPAVGVSE